MEKFKGSSIGPRLTSLGEQTNISASRCSTLPNRTHVPVLWPTRLSILVQWRSRLTTKRVPRASSRWRSSCKSSPALAQRTRPTSQLSETPRRSSLQQDRILSSNANGEHHVRGVGMRAFMPCLTYRKMVTTYKLSNSITITHLLSRSTSSSFVVTSDYKTN